VLARIPLQGGQMPSADSVKLYTAATSAMAVTSEGGSHGALCRSKQVKTSIRQNG